MSDQIISNQTFDESIEELKKENFTGSLQIQHQLLFTDKLINKALIWNKGKIIFGGQKLPEDLTDLTKLLGYRIYPNLVDKIIDLKIKNFSSPNSIQEMIHALTQELKVFSLSQIINVFQEEVAKIFDELSEKQISATITRDNLSDSNYEYGIDWDTLYQEVSNRKTEWQKLASVIPNYNYVPYVSLSGDRLGELKSSVRQHVKQHVNGRKTIIEISEDLNKDPLLLSKFYFQWYKSGWIKFSPPKQEENSSKPKKAKGDYRPKILCVDDSPVTHIMVKRALEDIYEVLTVSNGLECLQTLQKESINLILLDVSMPEINGLEICRIIRKMPKYKNLPIIMVTAKDGFVDQVKAKMFGSTKYMTKPFNSEELRKNIDFYLTS